MDWYFGVLKKYAVFTGRASREEYWMFFLFNIIIAFVIGLAGPALKLGVGFGNPLIGIYELIIFIPSLAVLVRRMHDTDHSGLWCIVPLVNLIFAVTPGTSGDNRFGPDPRTPRA